MLTEGASVFDSISVWPLKASDVKGNQLVDTGEELYEMMIEYTKSKAETGL